MILNAQALHLRLLMHKAYVANSPWYDNVEEKHARRLMPFPILKIYRKVQKGENCQLDIEQLISHN